MITSAPSNVKLIQKGEEAKVFDFFCKSHADNGFFDISSKKVIDMIIRAVKHENASIGLIEDYKGNIEAATGLILDQVWYSDSWYLSELLNYVDIDHRKSKHAKALLRFQKDFSDKMSTSLGYKVPIIPGIMTRKRLEAKIKMFQREFTQIGAIFGYNIQDHLPEDHFNQEVKYKKPIHDRNATVRAAVAGAG